MFGIVVSNRATQQQQGSTNMSKTSTDPGFIQEAVRAVSDARAETASVMSQAALQALRWKRPRPCLQLKKLPPVLRLQLQKQ